MRTDLNNEFDSKLFNLEFETVRQWAKDNLEIGNVLRGLTNECFALSANFEQSYEIQFVYVQFSHEHPGYMLELKFKENNFYNILLLFSLEITKINKKLEVLSVYNTFIHQLRTFFEANDIMTVTTSDLQRTGKGILVSSSAIEIIKTYNRVKFYRSFLETENYKNLAPDVEYVYIMMNCDDFTFKIGQSKNPKYRERTLQSKEPNVVLLKAWQCDKKIEKELHKIYKENRTRGEWFKLDFGKICNINETIINLIEEHKSQ